MAKLVSASLIGLGLFGGIGVPYYGRKCADYVAKLQLARAWPFSGAGSEGEWVRVEGQLLKTDVIQLEEQCYAPRVIYSYKTESDAANEVHINDAVGLKQHDFSKLKIRTQDALPFHFLSRGSSVKFVSSLTNSNNKVVVRYNKSNPSQSILEPQSGEYQLDSQSAAPFSSAYPPYVPLQSAPGTPIYASHLAPQNDPPQYHRVQGHRESAIAPRVESAGQALTYMLPLIHVTALSLLSQKLWRTHKLPVAAAWTWVVAFTAWGYTHPQLAEAWQYKSVTDTSSHRAALEHFEQNRYSLSRGYLKSWEHAKVVQL